MEPLYHSRCFSLESRVTPVGTGQTSTEEAARVSNYNSQTRGGGLGWLDCGRGSISFPRNSLAARSPAVAACLTSITIAYLAIAAIPPSITMPSVDAFISSCASGSTSLTASPTLIVIFHTQSSTNLLLGFKLNGSNNASWASMIELYATSQGKLGYLMRDYDSPDSKDPQFGKVSVFCLTYYRAHMVSVSCITYCRAHKWFHLWFMTKPSLQLFDWLMSSMVFYDLFVKLGMRNIFAPTLEGVLASP
ncbi:unnamed protein product [Prunus armeniaca]